METKNETVSGNRAVIPLLPTYKRICTLKRFFLLFVLSIMMAKALGQISQADTSRVYMLVNLAKEKQQQGSADSAEFYFKEAGKLAQRLVFDKGMLQYAGHYCVFLYQEVRYNEALAMAKKQLAISLKLKDLPRAAAAYNNMALQYQALGEMQRASEMLMSALNILSDIDRPTRQDSSFLRKYYNNLSSLLLDMNDLAKGLRYAIKSYQIAEELQDSAGIGSSLVNMLVAEAMSGKLADAEKHCLELLALGRSLTDPPMQLRALINLADIYCRQKRYEVALLTYDKAQALLAKAPPGNEVYILAGLSTVYKNMKRYGEADTYFSKALALAENELAKPQQMELLLSGAEIKEATGSYREALDLRKQYEQLSDSLLNSETHHTIQELEVKYQASEKQKALVERDLKISKQQRELERKNKWIILSILAMVILGVFFIFSRFINKLKRKAEASRQESRLLEAKLRGEEEERARTARELHDGVASILSAAKLHLGMELVNEPKTEGNDVNRLLESALKEIRNISHNLAPEAVLEEGFAYAIEEFCRRVRSSSLELNCYVIGTLPKFKKDDELLLYRMIQEAVANMVKHSEATEGIVQLVATENRLAITIEDNGVGFDVEGSKSKGLGLKNLLSRTQLLKGVCEIQSTPNKGTSIYIEVSATEVAESKKMRGRKEVIA
ncbi:MULTISPECIES: tetratricopeptide repeat-containing sensor histidine kinase [Olivibacter]|jgi:signal transduction histidine kinase|uniref:Tetratricopeptide repeat protein n=1 Tax=Olivibacter oleidegradans TaxID=760123 RepID=A0ABV6HJH3_9SPHI|nr:MULTISPECIES: tetratricopeptide repeat protein [Olivibacter]QEL01849.1 tetratricopeptide repeat protein [Olivibacter sp. LS-1]